MYKSKKTVGSNKFSAKFTKIISFYKTISYTINVLRQTACLVVNPITICNFAFLFNCTPAGRIPDYDGSDLKTYLLMRGLGTHVVSVVQPNGAQRLDFFYSGIQLYILLSPYFCFISFSHLVLYLLGVDTSIS